MDILQNINDLISKNKITKKEISSQIGVSRQHLYDILSGKQRLYVEIVLKISKVFEIEPKTLFEDKETEYLQVNERQEYYQRKRDDKTFDKIVNIATELQAEKADLLIELKVKEDRIKELEKNVVVKKDA